MNAQTQTNTNLNVNIGSRDGPYTTSSAHVHTLSNSSTSDGRKSWFGQNYGYLNGIPSTGVTKSHEVYNGNVLLTELDRGTKKVGSFRINF